MGCMNAKDIRSSQIVKRREFKPNQCQLDLMDKRRVIGQMACNNQDTNLDEIKVPDFVDHNVGQLREVYDIMEELGEGAYGQVSKCVHKITKEMRAVKILKKSSMSTIEKRLLFTEINNLKKLDHPNILKIFESYECPKYFYIVSELCEGGELFDELAYRGRFSEKDAIILIKTLMSTLNYCHQNNIMHRDIKPENILLEKGKKFDQIKLIDFGNSSVFRQGQCYSEFVGTAFYVAPEVIKRNHNNLCDIWSSGIIAYILLSGRIPFYDKDEEKIMDKIIKGKYDMNNKVWKRVSQQGIDFVKKQLVKMQDRPTAQECLNDPWLAQSENITDQNILNQASIAFENIIDFNNHTKLKQTVYSYLISQQVSKKERQEHQKIFEKIDKDNNGVLSKGEFTKASKEFFGEKLNDQQLSDLFDKADSNGNQVVSFNEFVLSSMDHSKLHDNQKLKAAFDMFDKNGDGAIDPQELLSIFNNSKVFDLKMANDMISPVDKDADGKIQFIEFQTFMNNCDFCKIQE